LPAFAQRLGCHPRALEAGLVQIPLSLRQRPLGLGELFPQPTLALILGLESRERISLISSARLGQGLDRLTQQLPRPGSPEDGCSRRPLHPPTALGARLVLAQSPSRG
jgi:hypothetical protein